MKRVKENDQKREETKEKETWVELKRQPAPPREAYCKAVDRNLTCWNPLPMNSWQNKCEK